MTAVCQLCSEIVIGLEASGPVLIEAPEEALALRDIQNFDLLAAAMMQHIMQRHGQPSRITPEDAKVSPAWELMAVSTLAAKVYAMTHAESAIANFAELRKSWRAAIMRQLFPAAYEAAANGSADSADSSI